MTPEEKPPEYREGFFSRQAVAEYKASVDMNPDDILVYGHTHDPFVDEAVANPGCWVSGSYLENPYLVIDDGRMELKFWDGRETEAVYIRHPGDGFSQPKSTSGLKDFQDMVLYSRDISQKVRKPMTLTFSCLKLIMRILSLSYFLNYQHHLTSLKSQTSCFYLHA